MERPIASIYTNLYLSKVAFLMRLIFIPNISPIYSMSKNVKTTFLLINVQYLPPFWHDLQGYKINFEMPFVSFAFVNLEICLIDH